MSQPQTSKVGNARQQQGRSTPAPDKTQKRQPEKQPDDLPGADGERSAGANEDTYD